jgi:DNA invertase Pin-like site-specific DNA recombinase
VKNKSTPKAVAFYRRSTVKSNESINEQKYLLIDYFYKHKIYEYKFYTDNGYSGGTLERPALKRLITDIEDGKISTVVVAWYHNLARGYFPCAVLEKLFKENDIELIVSQELKQ